MLVAGFPAAAFGTNCYVVAPGAGEECVVVDPGMEVADGLERGAAPSTGSARRVLLTHGHLDHMCSVTPVCGARDDPGLIHPDDRHLLADPMPGCRPRRWRMLRRPARSGAEPDDVAQLADGAAARARRAGVHRRPRAGPHRGLGDVPAARRARRRGRGRRPQLDAVAATCSSPGSIGRTDLPGGDHAAMLRQPARQGAAAGRRHRRAARPRRADHRSAASARPTRTCSRRCPTVQPARHEAVDDDQAHPAHRVPRAACPRSGSSSSTCSTPCAATFELHGFAPHRDPRRRAARPAAAQGRDSTRRSTSCAGCRPTTRPTRRRARACTSTSPCRSPATCWRTPASSSSRSAATRSRRSGAASGRRRAATASSPRPTSTSSAGTSCRSTTTSRCRG